MVQTAIGGNNDGAAFFVGFQEPFGNACRGPSDGKAIKTIWPQAHNSTKTGGAKMQFRAESLGNGNLIVCHLCKLGAFGIG